MSAKQVLLWAGIFMWAVAFPAQSVFGQAISDNAWRQIQALQAEKASWTPVQQKIEGHLLMETKKRLGRPIAVGVPELRTTVEVDTAGLVLVDIQSDVTDGLLRRIKDLGGKVVNSHPRYRAVRARVPIAQMEVLAAETAVQEIRPADQAMLNKTDTSEGVVAHRADVARATYGVDGTGVKIGVLSDSVESMAALQSSGDLPAGVTVLQTTNGSSEGSAMLEIVHDIAPGASLYFATAYGGQAQFAQNILNLRAAGCQVIVDDVGYFSEPVFQDGIIAQAVETVTASGAVYFSSAGNSGNLNDGTAGVWEGDFKGMSPPGLLGSDATAVNDFGGGVYYNTITKDSPTVFTLQWSDPWGASTNDYDLYLLSPDRTEVYEWSVNIQSSTRTPLEIINSFYNDIDCVLVVAKWSGADRYLHLNANRGRLAIATAGQTWGHSAAASAFSVAAVDIATAGGGAFSGGAANPVETFSSDGPRKIFYLADGTPVTPGNYSATGGTVRQKPDIAAADGVSCATPGFHPFYGTSAAAPHAAGIAALMIARGLTTPAQIRQALTNTAWDIEAAGVDRDSGFGILNAPAAVGYVVAAPEMDVQGNAVSIADGDATPSLADHTDFGAAVETGGTVVRTYAITNAGSAALNLTGTPKVVVGGAQAAEFTVTTQPTTPVAADGATIFQVTFDPAGTGLRSATMSIANDDGDENPYNFAIQGTGTPAALEITPANTNVGNGAASGLTLAVTANVSWTATTNASWLAVTGGGSGSGNGTVTFAVAANGETSARTGGVVVAGGGLTRTCTVVQAGAVAALEITPANTNVGNGAASGLTLAITANVAWTATTNASWLTVTSGTSGSGNGTVTFSVAANGETTARTGGVVVAGGGFSRTCTVVQAGAAPALNIDPETMNVGSGAASGLSLGVAANVSWTATTNAAWLTVTGGASGSGGGTVAFSVAANGETTARTGGVVVAGGGFSRTCTVVQAGAVPALNIDPETMNMGSGAASGLSLGVAANVSWTATTNASWLTVTGEASGSGNGTVTFAVAANGETSARTGGVVVAGGGISRTCIVVQAWSAATLDVKPASTNVGSGAASGFSLAVTGNVAWTATTNASWLTVTGGASGSGNGTVTFSVATNGETAARTGGVVVAGGGISRTCVVVQAGGAAALEISPANTNVGSGAASGLLVGVTANVSWTATTNASWLTVTSGMAGSGNGTVLILVAANGETAARTGGVVVAGGGFSRTCTVVQAGSAATLEVNPASTNVGSGAASGLTLAVTANVSWTAVTNAAWLAVTGGGSGSGNGTVTYSVAVNGETSARTGGVVVAGGGITRTCVVVQAGASAVLEISPTSTNLSSSAVSDLSLGVTANVAWTTTTNAAWLTVTGGASGSGNGTVTYSVAANGETAARTGGVAVAGGGITRTCVVVQAGSAAALEINPASTNVGSGAASGLSLGVAGNVAWTAATNASWLTVTAGLSGSGNGTVTYSVATNGETAARTGGVVVAGGGFTRTCMVVQAGGAPALAISPASTNLSNAAVSGVALGVAGNVAWTATSNAAWIVIMAGATGSGNGTVMFSVTANGETASRTGGVVVAGGGFSRTCTVIQAGSAAMLAISPASTNVGRAAASELALEVAGNVAWTAVSNAAWLAVTGGAEGSGNGTVTYSVAANDETAARTGGVVVAGGGFSRTCTVVQAGTAGTSNLIVFDSFDYPFGSIDGANGGTGWSGPWTSETGAVVVATGCFDNVSGYPTVQGGSLASMGDNATRGFPAVTNGQLYLAFMVRYPTSGGHKSGLVLTEAGKRREYFGYHTYVNGLYMFEYPHAYSGLPNSMAPGMAYTVIAKVDLDAQAMACMMLTNQINSMPALEPTTWQITKADMGATTFDGILLFGFTDGIHSDAIYDEIRIARTWEDLVSSAAALEIRSTSTNLASAAADGLTIEVAGNVAWTATTNASWLAVTSGASGGGNGTVMFSVATNSGPTARTGGVVVAGGGFSRTCTVVQAGNAATLEISPASTNLSGAAKGGLTLEVAASVAWTAVSNAAWLAVTGGSSGSGNGTVTFSVAANGGPAARTGGVVVAGGGLTRTCVVVQAESSTTSNLILVETFDYPLGTIDGADGGTGWSGTWTSDTGAAVVVAGCFDSVSGYQPAQGGSLASMGDNASRSFPAVTNGQLYLAFMVRCPTNPGHKSGLVLTDAGNRREYFGYHVDVKGLYMFEYPNSYMGLEYSMATGMAYTVIARVDLDAHSMACMMLTNQINSMPGAEPVTWQITKSGMGATNFDGILLFGFTDRYHSDAVYDEIRIARSWSDLVSAGVGLEIDPASTNLSNAEIGGLAIEVTANVAWTATSNAEWIAVTGGNSGSGNGTVTFSVATNSGPARMGGVVVSGGGITRTCTVMQAGSAGPSHPIISESFDYPVGLLAGSNGGVGWLGAWTSDTGAVTVITGRFDSVSGYQPVQGGSLASMGDNAARGFPAVTNGQLYLAFLLRYPTSGGHKSGLVLTDAGSKKEYFGYHTNVNGLYMFEYPTAYMGLPNSMASGTAYTVVAKVDLDAHAMACMMLTNQINSMPAMEPATWQLSKPTIGATRFDGILLFGYTDTYHSDAIYDEIRIARSWADLVSFSSPADIDGDDIRDAWELQWFGGLTNANAVSDWDGDHFFDWQEAGAGTNPTNDQSFLGMQVPAVVPDPAGILVQWQSVTGKLYSVWRTTNLPVAGGGFVSTHQHVIGRPSSTTVTDTTAGASALNIYRVNVE